MTLHVCVRPYPWVCIQDILMQKDTFIITYAMIRNEAELLINPF